MRAGSVRLKTGASARDVGFNGTAPYVAGDSSIDTMQGFQPSSMAPDSEIGPARNRITARARDLVRNNGWAAGAVAKEVDSIIGGNFRPFCKPDWRALGLDAEWAKQFKDIVEARWRTYADDPRKLADITRSQTVSQMFGTAYRTYLIEGDALGVVNWRKRLQTKTTLRLIDPDLLANPDNGSDSQHQRGGIDLTRDGAAAAYHFRQGHQNAQWSGMQGLTWKRIAARQSTQHH